MLRRVRALFGSGTDGDGNPGPGGHDRDDLELAVAVLLVDAARMDGDFDLVERTAILGILSGRLGFGADAEALVAAAEDVAEQAGDWYGFTRVVKDRFDYGERVALIGMLWEVALADGVVHDHEAALMRRLTGLLYVSDQDSGRARREALARVGREGPEAASDG